MVIGKKKIRPYFKLRCLPGLLPALAGLCVFYALPFVRIVYYSLIKNQFHQDFVGLDNYIKVIQNSYYRLAVKNTLLMIVICVPCYLLASLIISLAVMSVGNSARYRAAFVIPIVLPTASIVFIMRIILTSVETALPMYILFIWKYLGYGVILYTAAMSMIDKELYEAAALDGASRLRRQRAITLPLLRPVTCFVGLLSVVFCFRIYRESRIFFGTDYPPEHSYTLQYYMNNHFQKLQFQNLAVCAVLTTLFVLAVVGLALALKKRSAE